MTPRQSAFTDLQQEIGTTVEASKLASKLNAFIEKNHKLDVSSHSIDNGDIGSTKDYDNKNDDSQELITQPDEKIMLPSYLESERNSAVSELGQTL
jgi:hypothetical protein